MSIYIGWLYSGSVCIFDESTEETTSHNISQVTPDLRTFVDVLDELKLIVNVAAVKQLVFVHNVYNLEIFNSISEHLVENGFKSIYIQHWTSNQLQALLLKQNFNLIEGQNFLLVIKGEYEYASVWRYCNGDVEFVKCGPVFLCLPNFNETHEIIQLLKAFGIGLLINVAGYFTVAAVKYHVHIIVHQVPNYGTDPDLVNAALWTAKRQDGLVDGMQVGNFHWGGISVSIGDTSIIDNTCDGIPLPFNWSSRWFLPKFNLTAYWLLNYSSHRLILPANRSSRINVRMDRNGSFKIDVELKCGLGISVSQDSFYLVQFCDLDKQVVPVAKFPAALRFDCDPPKLTTSVSGDSVVADAIKMLDPTAEPKNGWRRIWTHENSDEFYKLIKTKHEEKSVTASFVVSEVFNAVISSVENASVDSNEHVCVAFPRFLTQKQREKLEDIWKLKNLKLNLVDEILAVAYGYSVDKGTDDGITLVMDLKTTGCKFTLIRMEGKSCEEMHQEEFVELKSECLREAMQIIFSSYTPLVQLTGAIELAMQDTITKLRQAMKTVLGKEQGNVQNVLLLGSCHLLPKLKELFAFSFLHANVVSLEESELCRLAAMGSILLHSD